MENSGTRLENAPKDDRAKLVDLADCEIRTEDGGRFPVHRVILAMESRYFFAMFCDFQNEKKEVLIRGIEEETFSNILSYIYGSNIPVTEANFCDLLLASDYFLLDDLLSQLKSVFEEHLSIKNCIGLFAASSRISQADIMKKSFRYIQTHFEDIVYNEKESIFELPLEELKEVLNDRSLRATNEKAVWLAIVAWVEAYLPHSLSCVPELLTFITLGEIKEDLAVEILNHDIVAGNRLCGRIVDIKSSNFHLYQLQVNQIYKFNNSKPNPFLYSRRSPPALHFISYVDIVNYVYSTDIYVTYDDKLDLWRKLCKIVGGCPPIQFLYLNRSIYVLKSGEIHRFNVAEKQWYVCSDPLFYNCFRKVGRLIYLLGGFSCHTKQTSDRNRTKIYDPVKDKWFETTPMFPVKNYKATVASELIYIVGNKPIMPVEMIAQVYDPSTQIWTLLPPPSIPRSEFSLVSYHEQIYVIGGTHANRNQNRLVEVFEPGKNSWHKIEDLPYEYRSANPFVINDRLIVVGKHERARNLEELYSVVMWNVDKGCWEVFAGPSPNIRWDRYTFYSEEDSECVNEISKENKDPAAIFEGSPFAETSL